MSTSRHFFEPKTDSYRLETRRPGLPENAPGNTPEELTREWMNSHNPPLSLSRRELFQRDLTDKNEIA